DGRALESDGCTAAPELLECLGVSKPSVAINNSKKRKKRERRKKKYEKELPDVDIFVCTADPSAEPPSMVMNTILLVMAYDYPPEKLNIYLSDDGASGLTFYAMLEASSFPKQWLPFCKKFKVESRSPEA
ncbi:hypothetical protein Goshw_027180, partial [Gossypium schwendimanii]|nr:hypothetical protein [Gossypium schwendimanii]